MLIEQLLCACHNCGAGLQGKTIAVWELGCKVEIGLNLIEKQFCLNSLDLQIYIKTISDKPLPSELLIKEIIKLVDCNFQSVYNLDLIYYIGIKVLFFLPLKS